jgi:hypothetical protein
MEGRRDPEFAAESLRLEPRLSADRWNMANTKKVEGKQDIGWELRRRGDIDIAAYVLDDRYDMNNTPLE